MSNTRQTRPAKNALELDQSGCCIICGTPKDNRRRGLCRAHYEKYRRAKAKVGEDELELWESILIAEGKILEDGRVPGNPFMDTLAELRASRKVVAASDLEDAEQEASDAARLAQAKRGHRQVETRKVAEEKGDYNSEKKPPRKKKSG